MTLTAFLILIPLFLQVSCLVDADWKAVTKGVEINADLQLNELQIKTSAEEKSSNSIKIDLYFYSGWPFAGGITVKFTSPMQYRLSFCEYGYTAFTTAPPTDRNKVWSILRTKTGLTVKCNGVVVLEYDTSVCDRQDIWGREIKQIEFKTSDGASEQYRVVSRGVCPTGYYKSDGMTTCEACEGGKEPNDNSTACVVCPTGYYKSDGMTTCQVCEAGEEPSDDHSACVDSCLKELKEEKDKLEEADKKIEVLNAELQEAKDKLDEADKKIEDLEAELNEEKEEDSDSKGDICPGKGIWTVPKSLVGKVITKKMIKSWKENGLEDNIRYLGPLKGKKMTKKRVEQVECFMTAN